MTTTGKPQFENKPVILIHLNVEGTRLAWCSEDEYVATYDTGAYPSVPRILCPACAKAVK